MSTKRVFYLDNIRFCASFLVILGHSHPEYAAGMSPEGLTQAGIWPSLFGLMSSPSSELFMTISGAILLPVRIPDKEFFKKRFSKVLFPLLIWSLIYLAAGLGPKDRTAVESLLALPFTPVLDVFWFMYVICGLYLFAPIISKWILDDNRASMRFYLGYLDVHFLSSPAQPHFARILQLPGQSLFCSQQLRRFSGLHGIGYLSEALPDVRQQKQVFDMLCSRPFIQRPSLRAQVFLAHSSGRFHLRQPLLHLHCVRLHHIHHHPVRFQVHHPRSARVYGTVQTFLRHLSFPHPHYPFHYPPWRFRLMQPSR